MIVFKRKFSTTVKNSINHRKIPIYIFEKDKKYLTIEEDNLRFEIFKNNFKQVELHNKEYEKGTVLYAKGNLFLFFSNTFFIY